MSYSKYDFLFMLKCFPQPQRSHHRDLWSPDSRRDPSISPGLRQGRPGTLPGLFMFLFYFYLTLLVMIDDDLSRTRSRHVPRFCWWWLLRWRWCCWQCWYMLRPSRHAPRLTMMEILIVTQPCQWWRSVDLSCDCGGDGDCCCQWWQCWSVDLWLHQRSTPLCWNRVVNDHICDILTHVIPEKKLHCA